jgi:cyclopropane fatty-acyl-phospholipid synthase-like methyltransferase
MIGTDKVYDLIRCAMDWIEGFYRHQRDLMPEGESAAVQRERLAIVAELAGPPPSSLLELGAGAGEFAVAATVAGHDVTAIELVDVLIDDAVRAVATAGLGSRVRLIRDDFYDVELTGGFDTVCYWDGFGVGTDADQRRLLARIATWLAPTGRALIDIYTPWYWAAAAGTVMELPRATRRYAFDARGCRMLDTWWAHADPDHTRTQSLRCYSPADLELLLDATGLQLSDVRAGGAPDPATGAWRADAPLGEAMTFVACLRRTGPS